MAWEFKRHGRTVNAHVTGRLVFNASEPMVAAARKTPPGVHTLISLN
jgi:hypothetical protein